MATSSVKKLKNMITKRQVDKNLLWVKWEVELPKGKKHVVSKDFIDPIGDLWAERRLELHLGDNPSLNLHFKIEDWNPEGDESGDEDEETFNHFKDFILTTECDGELIDVEPDMDELTIEIPVSKHLETTPGTILTFKFDLRERKDDESLQDDSDFLKTILGSSEFYDMQIITVDGLFLEAHKLVLSVLSPVIKAHFVHDGNDCNVFCTNFEHDHLESWLDHIYRRDKIDNDTELETVMDVFMVSDFFGSHEVSKHCREVIINRLSPSSLSRAVKHNIIYLAGDQAAKDILDYILQIIDKVGLGEIEGMDPDNPRIASFMAKILERTKKRKGDDPNGAKSKKQQKQV